MILIEEIIIMLESFKQQDLFSDDNLMSTLDKKADRINHNENDIDKIELTIADLKAQKEKLEAENEKLNKEITQDLDNKNIKKLTTIKYTFKARNYMPKVVFDDKNLVPVKFQKERIVTSINKPAIKDALKAGEMVAGAHLETTRRTVISENKMKEA